MSHGPIGILCVRRYSNYTNVNLFWEAFIQKYRGESKVAEVLLLFSIVLTELVLWFSFAKLFSIRSYVSKLPTKQSERRLTND